MLVIAFAAVMVGPKKYKVNNVFALSIIILVKELISFTVILDLIRSI